MSRRRLHIVDRQVAHQSTVGSGLWQVRRIRVAQLCRNGDFQTVNAPKNLERLSWSRCDIRRASATLSISNFEQHCSCHQRYYNSFRDCMNESITVETDMFEHREVKPQLHCSCCFGEDFAAGLKEQLALWWNPPLIFRRSLQVSRT